MFSRISEPDDMESICLLTESDSDTFSRNHNIPDLPNTKDYHLFVCYTDYNSADVRVIVENLECEGLKCCYHKRDFQPGQNVFHNINSAIKRSMGIIIILSEESVNSSFCQHEIQQAVHSRITDDYTIIPIKIEPCDIPDNLKTMTYIDAQNIETIEVHKLILNAFLQDGKISFFPQDSNVSNERKYKNITIFILFYISSDSVESMYSHTLNIYCYVLKHSKTQ
jgi:hypothetical protein